MEGQLFDFVQQEFPALVNAVRVLAIAVFVGAGLIAFAIASHGKGEG